MLLSIFYEQLNDDDDDVPNLIALASAIPEIWMLPQKFKTGLDVTMPLPGTFFHP